MLVAFDACIVVGRSVEWLACWLIDGIKLVDWWVLVGWLVALFLLCFRGGPIYPPYHNLSCVLRSQVYTKR